MRKISYDDNKNIIHDQLRYYREKRGLTQEQVVAQLQTMNVNIDQQALSKIEHNQRLVTDYEFACFCKILKVSEKDLLSEFYEKYFDTK